MKHKERVLGVCALAILCLILFFAGKNDYFTESPTTPAFSYVPELYGTYEVVRVIDGDTLIVDVDGEERRVRLIGVDTPESVHTDESKNVPEGEDAHMWLVEVLDGQNVYLEYDIDSEDDYGRTLAYVYLADGETMVNRLLIENGMAQTMTIQPNTKYADEFYSLQTAARENGAGFWGTGYFQ